MLVKVILCALLGLSIAQTTYDDNTCGIRPFISTYDQERVVNGTEAIPGDWGWACSMLYNGRHICGGSIIADQYIITAAHCTAGSTAATISWDCGLHDRLNKESWTINRKTERIFQHASYSSSTLRNDISVCKTTEKMTPYNKYILPACFPQTSDTYESARSWATGWGTLFSGGSLSRVNMQVEMPVLTDARCKQRFGNNLDVNSQVCAGEVGEGKDTCQGDSGGPLVVRHSSDSLWRLIGLTSWGYGCGEGGVYTRTSFFRSWVLNITGTLPTGN